MVIVSQTASTIARITKAENVRTAPRSAPRLRLLTFLSTLGVSNGRLSKEKIFKGLVVGGWLGTGGYGISKLIECQKKDDEERAQGKEPKRWCSPKRRSPKRIHWERQ